MGTDLHQILIFIAVVLWLDYIILAFFRKLKIPDYLGHILTGCLLLFLSNFPELSSWIDYRIFNHPPLPVKTLIFAGFFFYFFEVGYKIHTRFFRIIKLTDTKEVLTYSVVIAVLFAIASFYLLFVNPIWSQIVFIVIAFMGADIAGIISGNHFTSNQIRSRYQDFINFTLCQELITVILLLIFLVPLKIGFEGFRLHTLLLLIAGLILFLLMTNKKIWKSKFTPLRNTPLFLLFTGFLLILFVFFMELNLPVIITGLLCGLGLQLLVRQNQIFLSSQLFSVFRFFIIFPMIAMGTVLGADFDWMKVLLNALIILLILVLVAFVLGVIWMKNNRRFLTPAIGLLYRGEFTFLLLLWGYWNNFITVDILAAAIFLNFILVLIARFGLIYRLREKNTE